MEKSKLSI